MCGIITRFTNESIKALTSSERIPIVGFALRAALELFTQSPQPGKSAENQGKSDYVGILSRSADIIVSQRAIFASDGIGTVANEIDALESRNAEMGASARAA